MRDITVGILGVGRIGKLHADNLVRLPGVRLEAVADPYLEPEKWEARGIEWAREPERLIGNDDIEAVLICSPTPTHADLIEAAARAGKHIFCEKPIALDPERVRSTLEVVAETGIKLQIGFNRRFDPTFARLRQAVVEGEIGEVHLIKIVARDPEPPPIDYVASSGGMFLDMTIHDFDMVRFLSGAEVEEVQAFGAVLVDPAIGEAGDVDTAVVVLKLTGGALASIENSRRAVFGYDQRIEVFGSKGGIEAFNETPRQIRLRTTNGVRSENPHYFFLERYHQAYVTELEEFFSCIRDDRDPAVGGRDGLIPLLIGMAATTSMRENRPVRVERPEA
ncbi:MAG: inositol 2-dehydrogenase [Acidobacteria bacterium]|nr:MAG: inositol 2-dehydrogenase [Acidobacteriota bacterium]